jgi:predicted GNAT family N-acyltransferase
METRFASLMEILPLRQAVIIAGTNRNSPYFAGDEDETTRHVGVFERLQCIGCATFLRSEWDGEAAWQLRGMATAVAWRRRGVGRALLQFAESTLPNESGIRLFWCNAREKAVGFYKKAGWSVASERFDVQAVGPHYRMVKQLGDT